MSLSLDQLMAKYKTCKDHMKDVMLKTPWLRKQFLSEKLQEALKEERLEEARRIKDILRHHVGASDACTLALTSTGASGMERPSV